MSDLETLNQQYAVPGRLAFEESPLGGVVARLAHAGEEALVALHGAQVLNWTRNGDGLLWLSSIARIRDGRGIRGGIPVCWPWFADHSTDPSKPAHGFVRHRPWRVAGREADAASISLALKTATQPADHALWPHAATATVTVRLGDAGLSVDLETTNTGDAPFALTGALHTYFRLSDIANAEVTGLDGLTYLDKLEGFARKTQAGPIRDIAGEVDRIYLGDTARIALADRGTGRRIAIAGRGSRSAVVWNPWTDKTARLGDMGAPDAFRQMICVETANAGTDVVEPMRWPRTVTSRRLRSPAPRS